MTIRTNPTFHQRFVEFYKGNKLAILVTGGGISLGRLAGVPGASKVMHSFYCPYAVQESVQFIETNCPMADPHFLPKKGRLC